MLRPQQCWIRLHSSSNIVGATLAIMHGLQGLMGCILPTLHCRSQHCWELLHPLAHHWIHQKNTPLPTHPTTPNIVGATMLGVVASVCTQPNTSVQIETLNSWINLLLLLLNCQEYPAGAGGVLKGCPSSNSFTWATSFPGFSLLPLPPNGMRYRSWVDLISAWVWMAFCWSSLPPCAIITL